VRISPDISLRSFACVLSNPQPPCAVLRSLAREGSTAVAFPPPIAYREPETRSLTGPFFFLFQRGLVKPSDFRRLTAGKKSVSKRLASLSIRPSSKSRRIQNVTFFSELAETDCAGVWTRSTAVDANKDSFHFKTRSAAAARKKETYPALTPA
jgi:hypothetical protein